jgi:hypothetical protein
MIAPPPPDKDPQTRTNPNLKFKSYVAIFGNDCEPEENFACAFVARLKLKEKNREK